MPSRPRAASQTARSPCCSRLQQRNVARVALTGSRPVQSMSEEGSSRSSSTLCFSAMPISAYAPRSTAFRPTGSRGAGAGPGRCAWALAGDQVSGLEGWGWVARASPRCVRARRGDGRPGADHHAARLLRARERCSAARGTPPLCRCLPWPRTTLAPCNAPSAALELMPELARPPDPRSADLSAPAPDACQRRCRAAVQRALASRNATGQRHGCGPSRRRASRLGLRPPIATPHRHVPR
jgi:hypothetical protein